MWARLWSRGSPPSALGVATTDAALAHRDVRAPPLREREHLSSFGGEAKTRGRALEDPRAEPLFESTKPPRERGMAEPQVRRSDGDGGVLGERAAKPPHSEIVTAERVPVDP
jgi:hypothetical protein